MQEGKQTVSAVYLFVHATHFTPSDKPERWAIENFKQIQQTPRLQFKQCSAKQSTNMVLVAHLVKNQLIIERFGIPVFFLIKTRRKHYLYMSRYVQRSFSFLPACVSTGSHWPTCFAKPVPYMIFWRCSTNLFGFDFLSWHSFIISLSWSSNMAGSQERTM